jgi:putative transposase
MSERRACQLVNQPRGTQRYQPTQREDEDALTRAMVELASQYGRYGYRRITVFLQRAGWRVGKDRVERIWRREGLKVPQKQKPRGRLWLHDGSCIRLRPEYANHVWAYDFVSTFTQDGRKVRMLNLIDEFTRECLAIRPRRRLNSQNVIEVLADAMMEHGIPEHIRSDNGPEFMAKDLRKWLLSSGAKTLYIEPGSPWENGLLRIVQQQVTGRVPERRDLLLAEGAPGAGRAVARALQHREATLLVRLQAASTGCLADRKQQGAWKSGKPTTLPTFPHPRLRRDNYKTCRATLTISLVQKIG